HLRTVARLGNRQSMLLCRLEPRLHGGLEFGDRGGWRPAVRRAALQIWRIGDPALILVAPEDVDVVTANFSHPASNRIAGPLPPVGAPDTASHAALRAGS